MCMFTFCNFGFLPTVKLNYVFVHLKKGNKFQAIFSFLSVYFLLLISCDFSLEWLEMETF